jgi:tetratricopeptide (TPR) repeat protein
VAGEGRNNEEEEGQGGADIVRARNVSGGVHFHRTEPPPPPPGPSAPDVPVPRQLPSDIRGFVNRSDELRRLGATLTDSGVCVIAGTAGAGKTSLALRWAHQVKDRFPDGQLYVNLRGYDPGQPVEPLEALHRFLIALGVPSPAVPADPDAAASHYRSLLAERRVLLLLDNAATAGQVRPLLPGNADCLVIVTSRDRLSGLAVREGAHRLTLGTLTQGEAVALLRAVTTGYRPQEDATKLAELARLCGHLPLALRIAAERAVSHPYMRLDDLIASLRDESAIWDTLSTGDAEEADAVRTVFAWSYRALPDAAARLFRRLGLHPGPDFGVDVAAAIAVSGAVRTRQLLDTLVGAHLLKETAPDRYEFHDLLRAYAIHQSQHEEPGEEREAALRRALSWYLHTADAAQAVVAPRERRVTLDPPSQDVSPRAFADHDEAVDWSDQEHANLLAATHAAQAAHAAGALERLAWQLPIVHWKIRSRNAPVSGWLDAGRTGLAVARRLGERAGEAELLECLGEAYTRLNRIADSRQSHEEALTLRRELGDREGEAISLNALGLSHMHARQLDAARHRFERAIGLFRDLGSPWEASALANLAFVRYQAGHLDPASADVRRALTAHRSRGHDFSVGNALSILAEIQRERGEHEAALRTAQEAVGLALRLRNRVAEGCWLITLGNAQQAAGLIDDALESYHRSAVLHRRLRDRSREAEAWQGAGEVYARLEQPGRAAAFYRRAAAVYHELGDSWGEAVALDGLAAALEGENPGQARTHRAEALRLLAAFDDLRAAGVRGRIEESLGTEG